MQWMWLVPVVVAGIGTAAVVVVAGRAADSGRALRREVGRLGEFRPALGQLRPALVELRGASEQARARARALRTR